MHTPPPQEDAVIRVERLEAALAEAGGARPALEALHREFVDFHGEVGFRIGV
jgi:hypothetical protein